MGGSHLKNRLLWPVVSQGRPKSNMHIIGNQTTTGAVKLGATQNVRTLTIETAGDFCYGKITPKIRLAGQWLERAGFKPGHRVAVELNAPGTLTLRFLDQASLGASDSQHKTSIVV